MKPKLPSTLSVLYGLGIVAAMWQLYTIVNREPGDTFSATMRKLGKAQPFIVFMMGMLNGHWWKDHIEVFLAGVAAGMRDWPLTDGQEIQAAIQEKSSR